MSTQLTGSIVSAQVDTAIAEQLVGYRTFDTDAMMCPVWSGTDLAGRPVCEDSFYTKREGCNSALDRLKVENNLRPRYAEFLLDPRGIVGVGADYGSNAPSQVTALEAAMSRADRRMIGRQNGNFGVIATAQYFGKSPYRYDVLAANGFQNQAGQDLMALASQNRRNAQNLATGANMPQPNYNVVDREPMWRNDMCKPRYPTTYDNYVQVKDVCNHNPVQYI